MNKLWMIVVVLISVSAFSEENCPSANLYSAKNSHLLNLPIRHQTLGTCYAHSAAQMFNHAYNTDEFFAYWIALKVKRKRGLIHWSPFSLDSNTLAYTFSDFKSIATQCPRSFLTKEIDNLRGDSNLSDDLVLKFAHLVWKNMRFNFKDSRPIALEKAYKKSLHHKRFKGKNVQITKKSLEPMISYLDNRQPFLQYMEEEIFKNCPVSTPIETPQMNIFQLGSNSVEKYQSTITQSLSAPKPTMVAIGYMNDIWKKPEGTHKLHLRGFPGVVLGAKRVPHYSVIVAQKMIGGKCHYLVRNTLGKKYHHKNYLSHIEFLKSKKRTDVIVTSKIKKPYRVLGSWVSRDYLFDNAYELAAFPDS